MALLKSCSKFSLLYYAFLLILFPSVILAQDASTNRDIIVFGFHAAPEVDISDDSVEIAGVRVIELFSFFQGFETREMEYSFEPKSANELISILRVVRGQDREITGPVELGGGEISRADFNLLNGASVAVLPNIDSFELIQTDAGGYRCTIGTSYVIIDLELNRIIAKFSVISIGSSETSQSAVDKALDDIPRQLGLELSGTSAFRLAGVVIDTIGSTVMFSSETLEAQMIGDEYAIIPRGTGYENGIMVVKAFGEEVSVAELIFADSPVKAGDRVKRIPRIGLDTSVYVNANAASLAPVVTLGVRQSMSMGLFAFRPYLALEIPVVLDSLGDGDNPFSASLLGVGALIGGELMWRLDRFELASSIAAGMLGGSSDGGGGFLGYVGGRAAITVRFLAGRDLKLSIEAGYGGWFAFGSLLDPDDGLFAGIGAGDLNLSVNNQYVGLFAGVGAGYRY